MTRKKSHSKKFNITKIGWKMILIFMPQKIRRRILKNLQFLSCIQSFNTIKFNTLEDLQKIPEEYALWRTFYKHENGAQKITKVIITSTDLDLNSETIKTVNQIEDVTVKNGAEYLMELYF